MAADATRNIATRGNVFARIPLFSHHRSLDWWRARIVKPVAEAEEQGQPLVERGQLPRRKLAKHAPDPPLVNRSQMVDEREGLPGEAALARAALRSPRRGRVSLAPLHPTLAGGPPNWFAGTPVDQCLGIFLRQAARPFFDALLGEFGAFGVGILQ